MSVSEQSSRLEQRILVLAPVGNDATITCSVLEQAQFVCTACADMDALERHIEEGAAVALLTAESLAYPAARERMIAILDKQPPWSDLPIVLLISGRIASRRQFVALQEVLPGRNVTILQRPIAISTMVSIVRAALRARQRQYELRELIREQEQQAAELSAIIQSIPDAVFVGTESGMTLANEAARELLGLPAQDSTSDSVLDLLRHLDIRAMHNHEPLRPEKMAFSQALSGKRVSQEVVFRHPETNEEMILRAAAAPIQLKDGQVRAAVGVYVNVTEHHRAEVALRRSEARFRTSVDSMLDSFGIYSAIRDESGQIVDFLVEYINEAASRENDMSRDEQIGRRLRHVLPAPADHELFDKYVRVVETGEPLLIEEFVYVDNKQRRRAYDIRAARLGDGFVVTWRDVTERQQTREALQRAREELEQRVAMRTAELTYTNAMLQEQVEVREQAEEQLRQRNRELSTLNMITAAVSGSLELQAVLTTLQNLLTSELDVPGGAIFFYDQETDHLTLRHAWGLPGNVRRQTEPFPAQGSHFENVVREGGLVHYTDLNSLDLFDRWDLAGRRSSWQSYLCVPLLERGDVQGAFGLFSQQPTFSRDQREFFKAMGQQVGVAISNARLHAEVRAKGVRLQQLAQQIITVQEEERHRVSHELHDEAGQALTALMLSLDLARSSLPEQLRETRERIAEAVDLTSETMEQIRLLAHNLRSPSLDTIGLGPSLDGLCQDFAARTPLAVTYESNELPALPDSVAISLYRVAQEALANVGRHAEAEHVTVTLHYEDNQVSLIVEDDGQGFDPRLALASNHDGIGLPGVQERLEMLDGRLEIDSKPGRGTRLVAWVPLPELDKVAAEMNTS